MVEKPGWGPRDLRHCLRSLGQSTVPFCPLILPEHLGEEGPGSWKGLAPCLLTCTCLLVYRKNSVLAGGPHFIPAYPFYQKSCPWSCQLCLREIHPTMLWIWEHALTTNTAFTTPQKPGTWCWRLYFLFQNVKLVSFFLFFLSFFFPAGKTPVGGCNVLSRFNIMQTAYQHME